VEAANFLNSHYVGLDIEQVRERLQGEVEALRGEIATLDAGRGEGQLARPSPRRRTRSSSRGERNLLSVSGLFQRHGPPAPRL